MALAILTLVIGALPLGGGLILLWREGRAGRWMPSLASLLTCALAFNLTFIWQEFWLVLPKALTPGLHPVLFHNDHGWTGANPVAELLQGCGALATLASGLVFARLLAWGRETPAWRLFCFWMAFQGLYQALTQLAIGCVLPGNDMGRALRYLALGGVAKAVLLALAVAAMAFAGRWLGARIPAATGTQRTASPGPALAAAFLSVIVCIPFRVPRSPVEVLLVPFVIAMIGAGWLALGTALGKDTPQADSGRAGWLAPLVALSITLFVFQVVLRPGIRF